VNVQGLIPAAGSKQSALETFCTGDLLTQNAGAIFRLLPMFTLAHRGTAAESDREHSSAREDELFEVRGVIRAHHSENVPRAHPVAIADHGCGGSTTVRESSSSLQAGVAAIGQLPAKRPDSASKGRALGQRRGRLYTHVPLKELMIGSST
jgi:hypothetical protein